MSYRDHLSRSSLTTRQSVSHTHYRVLLCGTSHQYRTVTSQIVPTLPLTILVWHSYEHLYSAASNLVNLEKDLDWSIRITDRFIWVMGGEVHAIGPQEKQWLVIRYRRMDRYYKCTGDKTLWKTLLPQSGRPFHLVLAGSPANKYLKQTAGDSGWQSFCIRVRICDHWLHWLILQLLLQRVKWT